MIAIALKKYGTPITYTVTYNGNDSDGGTVPTDASSPYDRDDIVTVLGNTGTLTKSGYTFSRWNTAANGSGTTYYPADTFQIVSNITLYAVFIEDVIPLLTVSSEASRTSGVAPLSVHFLGGWEQEDNELGDFHSDYFVWDFDDDGCGNWHDGKSKDASKGAIACHIYETAGTFHPSCSVYRAGELRRTENFTITVTDPDTVYSGTNTTCVNPSGDSDFTGAPADSRHVSTNDLTTITEYATAGSRILFKRGCSWTVSSDLAWPDNGGPVTIGAYGTGTGADALGIYDNNPYFTLTGSGTNFFEADDKQNWRIMDLEFYNYDASDTTDSYFGRRAYALQGTYDYQRILMLRLKAYGCNSHSFAHVGTADYIPIDQVVFAACHFENTYMENIYAGAERLAIIGCNLPRNARSHVIRAYQGYHAVVQHNYCSGSSIDIPAWQQSAFKFHGVKEELVGIPPVGGQQLEKRTDYAIISDNVFGGCGPWPVGIGPQNTTSDERLRNIIIERNRFVADYGLLHSTLVTIGMHIWARYVTMRNNILDGTGGGTSYRAIQLSERGIVPDQDYVYIYNNTIYRGNAGSSTHYGIDIFDLATHVIARNNLVSFPYATGTHDDIYNLSADLVESNNIIVDDPDFIDPNNATPLSRNFNIASDSEAVNTGYSVPVYEDFSEATRPNGNYDIGAYEYS